MPVYHPRTPSPVLKSQISVYYVFLFHGLFHCSVGPYCPQLLKKEFVRGSVWSPLSGNVFNSPSHLVNNLAGCTIIN